MSRLPFSLVLLLVGASVTGCPSNLGDTAAPEDAFLVDADGDGSPVSVDCDDFDPAVHPGASETCNDVDDDCDGIVDDNPIDYETWYRDTIPVRGRRLCRVLRFAVPGASRRTG